LPGLWGAAAGELAHAFAHERELAGAGASCAGPQLGARAGGVVGAVVAVVDHDASASRSSARVSAARSASVALVCSDSGALAPSS
jgi:hypothetical protein